MQIGVPKETAEGERRVALVPDAVRKLTGARGDGDGPQDDVIVERGAGAGALIPDQSYEEAGAKMVEGPEETWRADVVVKVAPPTSEEIGRLGASSVLIGFLQPLTNAEGIRGIAQSGATSFA